MYTDLQKQDQPFLLQPSSFIINTKPYSFFYDMFKQIPDGDFIMTLLLAEKFENSFSLVTRHPYN